MRPATVPVPIATSRMSRKFPVRTRLLAAVVERLISVVALLASAPAILAPRQKWSLLLAQIRRSARVVEMRRIALARLESVLAAAAPSRLFKMFLDQCKVELAATSDRNISSFGSTSGTV